MPRGHLRVKAVAALHRWLIQQDWGGDLKISPLPTPTLLSDPRCNSGPDNTARPNNKKKIK